MFIMIQCHSCLHFIALLVLTRQKVKDLPIKGATLFSEKIDYSLKLRKNAKQLNPWDYVHRAVKFQAAACAKAAMATSTRSNFSPPGQQYPTTKPFPSLS